MDLCTDEERLEALKIVVSNINKCEKIQPKFVEGTAQHTLLKNRIKALYISKSLIIKEDITEKYTKEELMEGLKPVASIISKCEKAQSKYAEGTAGYARFVKLIKAMYLSKSLISEEINRR